jgi:hypothetical protein
MISFAMKILKHYSLAIWNFTMDLSENEKCLFTSLLYVCGKFTRALPAHQIFFNKFLPRENLMALLATIIGSKNQ